MFSVFLQNLALILVTLFIFFNHRADYTLFMAIAVILFTSFRIIFMRGSNSTKINYFLVQSFIFSLAIWYALFPRKFSILFE